MPAAGRATITHGTQPARFPDHLSRGYLAESPEVDFDNRDPLTPFMESRWEQTPQTATEGPTVSVRPLTHHSLCTSRCMTIVRRTSGVSLLHALFCYPNWGRSSIHRPCGGTHR